jgi:hypothetical protein
MNLWRIIGLRGALALALAGFAVFQAWEIAKHKDARQRASVALLDASKALAKAREAIAACNAEYDDAKARTVTRYETRVADCRGAYRAGQAAGRAETCNASCPDAGSGEPVVSLRDLPALAGEATGEASR